MADETPVWVSEARAKVNQSATYLQQSHDLWNEGNTRGAVFSSNGAINTMLQALNIILDHAPAPMTDKEVFLAWMRIANG